MHPVNFLPRMYHHRVSLQFSGQFSTGQLKSVRQPRLAWKFVSRFGHLRERSLENEIYILNSSTQARKQNRRSSSVQQVHCLPCNVDLLCICHHVADWSLGASETISSCSNRFAISTKIRASSDRACCSSNSAQQTELKPPQVQTRV